MTGKADKTTQADADPLDWATVFGWVLTFLYGVWVCLTVNWTTLIGLKPHELSDFLAGVFSPLAFLWLILGYMLQRKELRLQRRELQLQRETLKENNLTQADQQAQMKRQADVLSSQLEMATSQADLALDMVLVATNYSLGKATKWIDFTSVGPTCYSLIFHAWVGGRENGDSIVENMSTIHAHAGTSDVLRVGFVFDSDEITSDPILVTVHFTRLDGRKRIARYFLDLEEQLFVPLSTPKDDPIE